MHLNRRNGIFVISLDFELYWGVRDKKKIHEYQKNLEGVRRAIPAILNLFNAYNIHATWATVGFLFAKNKTDLVNFLPDKHPSYTNQNFSPYQHFHNAITSENEHLHFASDIIEQIKTQKGQEVATHTFSHYYCLEAGQSIEEFDSDLEAAIKIANRDKIEINSLIFPRNQSNEVYHKLLYKHGIKSYRGNESNWLNKASNQKGNNLLRRACRLIDYYVNITGHNTYHLQDVIQTSPYNIKSSRFLRPVSHTLSYFEPIRKKRIKNSILHAAKHNQVFHLWWHPHNFGRNLENNLDFLKDILAFFSEMHKRHNMQSMNMQDISEVLQKS